MDPEYFDELILSGAVQPVSLGDDGEFLYSFSENLEEINPGLHKYLQEEFTRTVMSLWELGFLTMDVTEEDPLISVTDKAFDEAAVQELPSVLQVKLKTVMDTLRRKDI